MTLHEWIGKSLTRYDAPAKVTGTSQYPADLVTSDMLHVYVVTAGHPHARIRHLDVTAARAHPGVVAVLTAADVPTNSYGLIEHDQPVLCHDLVRHEADRIALVVADSAATARAAAQHITLDLEPLPIVASAAAALEATAPTIHADKPGNLCAECRIIKGDVAAAFAAADVVVEHTFSTTWQEHAFLQPEAGIAFIDEHERVVVESGGQWLHEDRRLTARVLNLPEEQVVMRYATVGGAFGGREDLSVQHLLALAAWHVHRPVALVWSREESIRGHVKRHPTQIKSRWAATRDGTITAAETHVLADGGAYASTSAEVIKVMALFATGCYEIPNIASTAQVVYTNNIPAGAFRGFGAPQIHIAAEVMLTKLAHALNRDPVDLRLRHAYRNGSIEPTHNVVPAGASAVPVIERCAAEVRARCGTEPPAAPHLKRGVGLAAGIKNVGYSFGFPERATATVELYGTTQIERAVVRAAAAEVGQGSHVAMRQIAAARLGIHPDQVTLISDDSSAAPNVGSASASRLTFMAGRAIHDAAVQALQEWHDEERPAIATVQYHAPRTTPLDPVTTAGVPNYCYGYTAQAAEVEVNTLTGQVRVLRVISVHDVGTAINMQQVIGQIEGCVVQALGYALLENFQMHDGMIQTQHFSNYLLPTISDIPDEIVPVVLELADPHGPFGARGVGEMPFVALTPAIMTAIHAATGVWVTQQPITPERVLAAIQYHTLTGTG